MIGRFYSRQFILFLITGGIAAVINFSSRTVYGIWLDFSASVLLAYLTGMITAFILAKMVVFKEGTETTRRSIMWFTLINLVAVLQTWCVSLGLANYLLPFLGVKLFVREIAHAVGLAVPVVTSYLGHKRWSFRTASL